MKLVCSVLSVLAWVLCPAALTAADPLIGQPAPDWQLTNWLNSAPLALKDLRGQVVLVRWWTAPQCEFCRATAPALNDFHADFTAKGLRVIGVYHHKLPTPLDPQHVAERAAEFGFKFPVAVDPGWRTLRRWWLDGQNRDFTSVSFLLDRHGVIRHIHPGGQYVKGDADHAAMKQKIAELLAEKSLRSAASSAPTSAASTKHSTGGCPIPTLRRHEHPVLERSELESARPAATGYLRTHHPRGH